VTANNTKAQTTFDDLEIRCPKLGGEITFGYCRKEAGELPCPRVIVCWHPYFPVEAHLKEHLSAKQWHRCFDQPPKDKVSSLVELIEKAKERKGLC
jgi:hypothetical protein